MYVGLALAALLALAAWRIDANAYQRGQDACNARVAAAVAEARSDEVDRDRAADTIATDTREEAQAAQRTTQQETTQAVEVIRYVTHTIEVPVGCPVGLPDRVRDEGREAVRRARAAQG